MHLGNLLLASAPCACHVMPLLGSSSLFHASSKVWKTLGPFVKKRSQAPGWHAKRSNMQFHLCFTGQTGPWSEKPPVFTATFGGSQGPPGRAPRGLQEASLQPCPQEAPKRCHMSSRGPLAHKRVTSVSQACRALSTLGQPRRDTRSVNNYDDDDDERHFGR